MFKTFHVIAAVGLAATVVACAPQAPEPIAPEPIYNKYGEAIAECRPRREPFSRTYLERLPICEDLCRETGRATVNANVPGTPPFICPPRPDDGDNGNGYEPRDPTGAVPGRP